jgi:hypothetical protein
MKRIMTFVAACMCAATAFSQQVTVTVSGNKNSQVVIDGQTYTPSSATTRGNKNQIVIPNLSSGQHTIAVYRGNANNRRSSELYSNSFTLRPYRDLQITVNGNNGRVKMVESSNNAAYDPYGTNTNNNYRVAMADADFNNVYQSIRGKWLPGAKMTAATTVFNNTSYNFSSTQARQIIQLLSSEQNRLDLAKLAFDNVVDPTAYYSQVADLLGNQSSRDELNNYIRSYGSGY